MDLKACEGTDPPSRLPAAIEPRELGGVHLMAGVGGGGKTHEQLIDTGLRNTLFVPPSYELREEKVNKYGVDSKVLAVALGGNHEAVQAIHRYYGSIIWDEVSQWSMQSLEAVLTRFPYHQHILCGDPGFQFECIFDRAADTPQTPFTIEAFEALGFPVTHYTFSHRCKCDVLRGVQNTLRQMIKLNLPHVICLGLQKLR